MARSRARGRFSTACRNRFCLRASSALGGSGLRFVAADVGRSEAEVGEEVVQGDQVGVGGGGGALERGLEVGAVVAGGEVAPVRLGERVATGGVGVGQPGQEAAHAGGVGAAGVGVPVVFAENPTLSLPAWLAGR